MENYVISFHEPLFVGHLPLAMFSLGGLLRTGCGTSQNSSLTDFMGPQFCSEIEVPLKQMNLLTQHISLFSPKMDVQYVHELQDLII
jgi:hypothetical protein